MEEWENVKEAIITTKQEDLLSTARDLLWKVAEIPIAALYLTNAATGSNERTNEMCRIFLMAKDFSKQVVTREGTRTELANNKKIIFGNADSHIMASKL